jgi:hypothetical protein
MADPPERIPPPPFWRTRYYALEVMTKPGRRIDPIEIERALAMPARHEHQPDGRIRHWRWVAEPGRLAAGRYRSGWRNRAQRVLG